MTYEKDTYLEMMAKGINYDEMLKLDEENFKNLLLVRNEYNRTKLLEEMIDHEERMGSLKKSANKKEITKPIQTVLDIFDREKNKEIVLWLEKLKEHTEYDAVEHAIFAKAATDRVNLL